MSAVDFQNGLICGLAARGMVKSGIPYQPRVWNDEGVYDYFYIDFKRSMEPFSLGMFNQSIVVHDSEQLYPTGVTKVSAGIYRVDCNISNRYQGITVLNKITSLLSFSTGQKLPPFSVHFFVSGLVPYERLSYAYEVCSLSDITDRHGDIFCDFTIDALVGVDDIEAIYEDAIYVVSPERITTELATLTLT